MKKFARIIPALLAASMLAGCSGDNSPAPSEIIITGVTSEAENAVFPVKLDDGTMIDHAPESAASLSPAATEILAELGYSDRLTAVCRYCDFPEGLTSQTAGSSENPDIDKLAAGKARMIFLNKADLADDQATLAWMDYFRKKGITPIRLDARKTNFKKAVVDGVKIACQEKIERDRRKGILNRPIRAMVVGIPNVGKSTFINSLAGKTAAKTGNKPGVTRGNQWIKIDKQLELLDTPGILWPKFDDEAIGMKLACVGSISDEVLNMQEIAYHLLSYGKANYNQLFEARYGAVPQPDDERDNEIVLWMENIARQRGCLKRGAETDFDKVSAQITDDFRSGRIGKVSLEVPKQA